MTSALPVSSTPATADVLLVLLPPVAASGITPTQTATVAALQALQLKLGSGIRVLLIDETTHPLVVRSFHATELPAFVLVRQGIELWRQQGLPEGEFIVPLILSKLRAATETAAAVAPDTF